MGGRFKASLRRSILDCFGPKAKLSWHAEDLTSKPASLLSMDRAK